jgi:signal transduction histidine kinase
MLASGLLDQEQAEQGRLVLRTESCDLVSLAYQVRGMLRQEIAERIEIEADLGELLLVADPARLQQVLYNLMDNAVKYTLFQLPIQVTLGTEGGWAVVHVRDHGRGMAPEQIAQLFQMYYRAPEARQGPVSGTGLGLFIVKALVEAHGGQVIVDSSPGQGTQVSVYLPVAQVAERTEDRA